jgi:carbonic anhydrase
MMKRYVLLLVMVGSLLMGHGDDTKKPSEKCSAVAINAENSQVYAAVVNADNLFATTYQAQPSMFANKKIMIVTCMDYRIDLSGITGLGIADMYVLRNAGGRVTDDVLRSLIIAQKLLGIEEIFLIQHTDCGMQKFTDRVMNTLLSESIVKANLVKNCNTTLCPLQDNNACKWQNTSKCCGRNPCANLQCINWYIIKNGLFESVLEDVIKMRKDPFIPLNIPIYGFIFDVLTGKLIPVPKAMEAGRAKPYYCKC